MIFEVNHVNNAHIVSINKLNIKNDTVWPFGAVMNDLFLFDFLQVGVPLLISL